MYLALFMLFTSATAESPIIENLFLVRICTSSEGSINSPWITNKNCSIWICLKMGKYWEKISVWQNLSYLVVTYTGWSLISIGVWPGFNTAIYFIFNYIKWACILEVLTLSRNNGRMGLILGEVCKPRFCDAWCPSHPVGINWRLIEEFWWEIFCINNEPLDLFSNCCVIRWKFSLWHIAEACAQSPFLNVLSINPSPKYIQQAKVQVFSCLERYCL